MADVSTKRILDVLGHAIELAQNELDQQPEQEIKQPATPQYSAPALQPIQKRTGTKNNPLLIKNEIKTFYHPEFGKIEATVIDGKPYFKALSIVKAIGYRNPASIAEICSDKRVIRAPKSNGKVDSVTYISADDVHQMMSRRKVELLFEFEEWLDGEIIPKLTGTSVEKKYYPPMKTFSHPDYGVVTATFVDGETYYRTKDILKMCGYHRSAISRIQNKYSFAVQKNVCAANSTFVKEAEVRIIFGWRNLDLIPVTKKMLDWVIYDISEQMRSEFADSDSTIA